MIMNNKPLVFIPLILLGFAASFYVGKVTTENEFQKNWSANEQKLSERFRDVGVVFPSQVGEVRALAGQIKKIDARTLTITLISPRDPFGDASLDEREVDITESTKISKLTSRESSTMYQQELSVIAKSAVEKSPPAADYAPTLANKRDVPPAFENSDANLPELAVGQYVTITTVENVKDKKRFTADTIEITGYPTPSSNSDVTLENVVDPAASLATPASEPQDGSKPVTSGSVAPAAVTHGDSLSAPAPAPAPAP